MFKILDLFSGAGGFSLGMNMVDTFETKIAVDFNKYALETLKYNKENVEVILGDISSENIKDKIIDKCKKVGINMVIGGPPCQGFSLKGKNKGLDDPRNFLFKEFVEIVAKVDPEIFVIENVKNLLNACDGYFIKQIVKEMEGLGYIINFNVLNSVNYGVPEKRERAFIIGSKSKHISFPGRTTSKDITVRDAISDLAYLNSSEGNDVSNYINEPKSDYQKSIRNNSIVLYNHKATSHSDLAIKKLKMIPSEGDKSSMPIEYHGKQKFSTTWSRLIWDSPSPTIDTRFDTPSNGRNSHPELHRSITPREAARIQSFPDTYRFLGSKTEICKQIGNAVPPLMAKAIAESIKSAYSRNKVENDKYTIYNGDSLNIVKELKKENMVVNHIITDPPYNISKENNFSTMKSKRLGVDFGEWDKKFDLTGWISEYKDILDKNGSMIIFCSYLFISEICESLNNNGMEVKDIIIWKKSNPMPRNINRRYVQDMEFAIWAVKKNSKWIFNKPENTPYLRSIYEASLVSGSEKLGHPTQKSVKIMNEIIKVHTNEGDIILDPFMGSGTTGDASLSLNRKFIGIELNEDYYKMTRNRLIKFNK